MRFGSRTRIDRCSRRPSVAILILSGTGSDVSSRCTASSSSEAAAAIASNHRRVGVDRRIGIVGDRRIVAGCETTLDGRDIGVGGDLLDRGHVRRIPGPEFLGDVVTREEQSQRAGRDGCNRRRARAATSTSASVVEQRQQHEAVSPFRRHEPACREQADLARDVGRQEQLDDGRETPRCTVSGSLELRDRRGQDGGAGHAACSAERLARTTVQLVCEVARVTDHDLQPFRGIDRHALAGRSLRAPRCICPSADDLHPAAARRGDDQAQRRFRAPPGRTSCAVALAGGGADALVVGRHGARRRSVVDGAGDWSRRGRSVLAAGGRRRSAGAAALLRRRRGRSGDPASPASAGRRSASATTMTPRPASSSVPSAGPSPCVRAGASSMSSSRCAGSSERNCSTVASGSSPTCDAYERMKPRVKMPPGSLSNWFFSIASRKRTEMLVFSAIACSVTFWRSRASRNRSPTVTLPAPGLETPRESRVRLPPATAAPAARPARTRRFPRCRTHLLHAPPRTCRSRCLRRPRPAPCLADASSPPALEPGHRSVRLLGDRREHRPEHHHICALTVGHIVADMHRAADQQPRGPRLPHPPHRHPRTPEVHTVRIRRHCHVRALVDEHTTRAALHRAGRPPASRARTAVGPVPFAQLDRIDAGHGHRRDKGHQRRHPARGHRAPPGADDR